MSTHLYPVYTESDNSLNTNWPALHGSATSTTLDDGSATRWPCDVIEAPEVAANNSSSVGDRKRNDVIHNMITNEVDWRWSADRVSYLTGKQTQSNDVPIAINNNNNNKLCG